MTTAMRHLIVLSLALGIFFLTSEATVIPSHRKGHLTAYTNANAFRNEIEDDDFSIEDTARPRRPFYDTRYDLYIDDPKFTYWKKWDEKKTKISKNAIFLPHETYCQYFYAFDGKDSYVFRCASGYRFDAETLQCLKSKYVNCGKRKKKLDSSKESSSSEEKYIGFNFKCPKWNGLHPHNYYCQLYFICENKKPSLYMCPPGRLFDSKTSKCLVWDKVYCAKRENPYEDFLDDISHPDTDSDKKFNCADPAGVYPDIHHCNRFIRCWYGLGEYYVCPEGKLFDEDLKKCKSKDSVHCDNRFNPYSLTTAILPTEPLIVSTTQSETESTTEEIITTTEEIITTTEITTTKIKPTGLPDHDCDENDLDCIITETGDVDHWFKCPQDVGAYPHPSSDKLFIFCMNWIPYAKKCGMYTVFSKELSMCVEP